MSQAHTYTPCFAARRALAAMLFLALLCSCGTEAMAQRNDDRITALHHEAKDSIEANPAHSIDLALRAYQLARIVHDTRAQAISLNIQASALHQAGKMSEAVAVFRRGIDMAAGNGFRDLQADMLLNLGIVYENQGTYKNAMQQYEAAMLLFSQLRDTLSLGNCAHNMGVLALHMNNLVVADRYFATAVAMYAAAGDMPHLAGGYIALGGSYIQQKRYREALGYLLHALQINSLKNDESAAIAHMNIGMCYQELKVPDSALLYYNRSQEIFRTLNTTTNEVFLSINMGSVYDEILHRPDLAIKSYKQGVELAREINYPLGLGMAYSNLAEMYQAAGNYKTANEYMQLQMAIKDTLLNREKVEALEEMAARYKTRELDDRNRLLRKENDLQRLRLRHKDLYIYSGFGAALLFLVIGLLVVRHNRLRALRQKLELEQRQLQAQMNPHFIFNCLNSIQQFVVQNDRANANKYLADFALLMRQTLDNSKDGTISLKREVEYLENYLSFEHMRYEDKFSYSIECAPGINVHAVEIPAMIVQPFAENAVKHGLCNMEHGGGRLKVSFYHQEGHLYCEVDDNGIGIEEAQRQRQKSFIKYQSHGMELTRQRLALAARMQSGDYTITIVDKTTLPGNESGTRVIIKFPIGV